MEDLDLQAANPRPATLKRINMRRFLEELRRRGPSTRADLTRAIGVTPPTSSSIIADLMETGFLEEADQVVVSKGRPGKFFRLATQRSFVIGATIDIQECLLSSAGLDGVPRQDTVVRFPTPMDYDSLVARLAGAVREIIEHSTGSCLGLGVAVPGLVFEKQGRVAFSPNLHFLDGRPLAEGLRKALGIQVELTQEEHALCLSEQHMGNTQSFTDFAVVDFSSGVGMGVVSEGRYVSGKDGFAGEIGHTTVVKEGRPCGCGNRGCLETVASDLALLRNLGEKHGSPVSFADIEAGRVDASSEVREALEYIAIGLATVLNLFNPEAVFLHGRIFGLGSDVMSDLELLVRSRALGPSVAEVKMIPARGDKLHGSIAGLLDRIFAAVGPKLR